jgi:multidrug resistance efflux pump
MRASGVAVLLGIATLFPACQRHPAEVHAADVNPKPAVPGPHSVPPRRYVRATGTVFAVRSYTILVPQLTGQFSRMTLTRLAPNGARVKQGDVIAEFDRTQQVDNAREAQAKFEDLGHQVEQRVAQNRAESEKRLSELQKAEADLAKAMLQLRKGPLLSEIDRLKAETRAGEAKERVDSLKKSNHHHEEAEAAALRILELQRDRQQVSLERSMRNSEKLLIRAPLPGMIAHEVMWRNGTSGHAQEGDQLYPGMPLFRIFDPTEMEVRMNVAEPDGAVLVSGSTALVHLDAYPDLIFHAKFFAASPVAASSFGSPIKTFAARFRLQEVDPHLLPDMSAAVIIEAAP